MRPVRASSGTRMPLAASAAVWSRCPSESSQRGLGPARVAHLGIEGPQPAALRERKAVEALEPPVPEQERRVAGAERAGQLFGQAADERGQLGQLEDAVAQALQHGVAARVRQGGLHLALV